MRAACSLRGLREAGVLRGLSEAGVLRGFLEAGVLLGLSGAGVIACNDIQAAHIVQCTYAVSSKAVAHIVHA